MRGETRSDAADTTVTRSRCRFLGVGNAALLACVHTRGACTCVYQYGKEVVQSAKKEVFQEIMASLTSEVFSSLGMPEEEWPNSCNLNLYEDGSQAVGWHADDEKLFGGKTGDCTIVSLSFMQNEEKNQKITNNVFRRFFASISSPGYGRKTLRLLAVLLSALLALLPASL